MALACSPAAKVAPRELPPAGLVLLHDDFDGPRLNEEKWIVARRNWGGKAADGTDWNGGVIAENVEVRDGRLVVHARGDHYRGPLRGVARDGRARADGRRSGGAVQTVASFSGGRFEARMRPTRKLGVVSAMWTFAYEEHDRSGTPPSIINHEIDFEVPGRPGAPPTGVTYDYALLNSWRGVGEAEHSVRHHCLTHSIADGNFHTFAFDWRPPAGGDQGRIDFYLDGVHQYTITTTVPSLAGQLWLGAWFPKNWAGWPEFDSDGLEIDWVRISRLAPTSDGG